MADETRRFRLTTFDSADERLDAFGYKFTDADRYLLDRLLTRAVEHRHTGEAPLAEGVPAPTLALATSGGAIPAATSVSYRYTVVDASGEESAPSPIATIPTPARMSTPAAPTVQAAGGNGALTPGLYTYAVSFYVGHPSNETLASGPVSVDPGRSVPPRSIVLVNLPERPAAATGYNIYRKAPGESRLTLLQSWAGGPSYTDMGLVQPNRARYLPVENSTFSTNAVTVTFPGAPAGSYRLYRTYDPSDWVDSLVEWAATGAVVDRGFPTRTGSPPFAAGIGNPPKVDLNNAAEVQGQLPPGRLVYAAPVTFTFAGPVAVGPSWAWLSEYSWAYPFSLQAHLGRGSTPAATPVRVGLETRRATATAWTMTPFVVEIPVGQQASNLLPISSDDSIYVRQAQRVRAVVLQAGGGSPPTDRDLVVTLTLLQGTGSNSQTYDWGP